MTAKRGDLIRDVAVGLTLAISVGSAVMTVIDRTTGGAKAAEQVDGRLKLVEQAVATHTDVIRLRGRWVNEASNQLNYLCATAANCRALYTPIAVPE